MVELVDTLASGASESNLVKVRVLSSAPNKERPKGCFLFGMSGSNRTAKPRFDYDESAQEIAPST